MDISLSEYNPGPALAPYLHSYWIGDFNIRKQPDFSQAVVPNGCIELIIHTTEDHCYLTRNGKEWEKSPPFTLLGMYEETYSVQFSGQVRVFAIRFYPDGVRNIFGVPPSGFLSSYETGEDVLGARIGELGCKIREAKTPGDQVALVEEFLIRELENNNVSYDYTHWAMEGIRKSGGLISYRELTEQLPIGDRQLQREFKNAYGISVTKYLRLIRMNTIHKYMTNSSLSLTGLSYELDFADQSHLIKEFKKFMGRSPRKFLMSRDEFIVNLSV
jgi:AraC-like DNA-binding protein